MAEPTMLYRVTYAYRGLVVLAITYVFVMGVLFRVRAVKRITLATAERAPMAGPVGPAPSPFHVALQRKVLAAENDGVPWYGPLARAAYRRYGARAGAVVMSLALRAQIGMTGAERAAAMGVPAWT